MQHTQQPTHHIIGFQIRTHYTTAAQDMGLLWQKAMQPDFVASIPDAQPDALYVVYTNYDSDYQGAYDAVIGYAVPAGTSAPAELVAVQLPAGTYTCDRAQGDLVEAVPRLWQAIWQRDQQRSYQADYEVYTNPTPETKQVEVYVGICE